VTRPVPVARPAGWADTSLAKVGAIAQAEISQLRHDPYDILTRAVQPFLWLAVFGQAMSRLRAVPTGPYTYLQFLAPGILAQSVVFIAIFYGIAVIWERDLGILQKMLVTPTPRYSIVVGKMLAAGLRGTAQAAIVLIVSLFMAIPLHYTAVAIVGCLVTVILGAGFFAGFSMIMAALVRSRERFMGIGQVLTMPLFFASNALYPLSIMPAWLKVISVGNPLSYLVDALRTLLLGAPGHLPLDYGVLLGAAVAAAAVAAQLYPRLG
jgi:ABC-2 type transport system permease protein